MGHDHANPAHIETLDTCSKACATSANFMLRDSKYIKQMCDLCANTCTDCADSCNQFTEDFMQDCATTCQECARTCRQMAT